MSSLREVAEDYLRMRRALGYKLKISGWHLGKFVTYLEQTDAETVTIENAVAWATSAGTDPSYWAQRLSIVRQFARHLQTIDPGLRGTARAAAALPGTTSDPVPL